MSGDLLVAIELLLVFGVAFGWGLNELRQLKQYKKSKGNKVYPDNSSNQ